jgi:hypothetical protein
MHQVYSYLEDNPGRSREDFHELSHGEGFLEILRTQVNEDGFYLMDEPDAPLSFTASLGLAALLHDLAADRPSCWSPATPPSWPRSPARTCLSSARGVSGPLPGTT